MVSIHRNHAPQSGAKGRGGGEHLLGGQTRGAQRCVGVLQNVLLRHHAPRYIYATPNQTDAVGAPTHEATAQGPGHTSHQGQAVERVDDEQTAQTQSFVGERQKQLCAVNREPIQDGVRHQSQGDHRPPTALLMRLTLDARDTPRQRPRGQGQPEQRVCLSSVQDHVEDRVPVV